MVRSSTSGGCRISYLSFEAEASFLPVTCLTTDCASYDLLVDLMGQVKAVVNPPNYTTSKHHSMDMGIIAVTQLHYGRGFLSVRVLTSMAVADVLWA